MAVFHQNVILPFCFILQIPQTTVDTIINQENDPCFDSRHQAQHNGFVRGVTHFPFQQALVVNKAENPGLNFIRKYRLTGVHLGEDLTGTHIDDAQVHGNLIELVLRVGTDPKISCPNPARFDVAFITDNRTFNHDICRR